MKSLRSMLVSSLITGMFLFGVWGCSAEDSSSAASAAADEILKNIANLSTELETTDVVPTVSDRDDSGVAYVLLLPNDKLSYWIRVEDLDEDDTPTTAKIYQGEAGVAGTEYLELVTEFGQDQEEDGALDLTEDQVDELTNNAGSYYVQINTELLPEGAMRGQLDKRDLTTEELEPMGQDVIDRLLCQFQDELDGITSLASFLNLCSE